MASRRERVEARIAYLQSELDNLKFYLPETYQYLMEKMDAQQRELMQLKIQDFYRSQQS
jgi:hypothetical protein